MLPGTRECRVHITILLEGAVDSVLEGYVKMLERVEAREKAGAVNGEAEVVEGAPQKGKRKKLVVEDEESEHENLSNGHKKARVEA